MVRKLTIEVKCMGGSQMSEVIEKIMGVFALMNEREVEKVWEIIQNVFIVKEKNWEDIETEEPDNIDIEMLKEIDSNLECNEFIPAEEAYKELGLICRDNKKEE
jgi:hypothetical protein